jgi:hypothetical protein
MLNKGFLELVDAAYSEDGAVEDMDVECDILDVIYDRICCWLVYAGWKSWVGQW